jgi:carbonic anhydrase
MVKRWMTLLVLFLIPALSGAEEWSYEGPNGPAQWPGLCASGTQQSPIDISVAAPENLPPIDFYCRQFTPTLNDNGHTLQIHAPWKQCSIVISGAQYYLTQFHFHHPGEEKVMGKAADLEIHFIFRSDQERYAVLSVLVKRGQPNALMERLLNRWPAEVNEGYIFSRTINVAEFMPASRGYYMYDGSLTSPPCTEGLPRIVMKTPIELSEEQIARFAKKYPHNIRPTQALHGRQVRQTID